MNPCSWVLLSRPSLPHGRRRPPSKTSDTPRTQCAEVVAISPKSDAPQDRRSCEGRAMTSRNDFVRSGHRPHVPGHVPDRSEEGARWQVLGAARLIPHQRCRDRCADPPHANRSRGRAKGDLARNEPHPLQRGSKTRSRKGDVATLVGLLSSSRDGERGSRIVTGAA